MRELQRVRMSATRAHHCGGGDGTLAAIFQGICRSCRYQTMCVADHALAILIKRDHPALTTSLNTSLISNEIGDLATAEDFCCLSSANPLEHRILSSTGATFREVSEDGRLVSLTRVVCRACGTIYQRRRLITWEGLKGCLPGRAVLLVGSVAGVGIEASPAGFGAGCAVSDALYSRDLPPQQAKPLPISPSRNCGWRAPHNVQNVEVSKRRRSISLERFHVQAVARSL